MRNYYLLIGLALATLVACSDDDDKSDGGVAADQKVTVDTKVADKQIGDKAAGDKAVGDKAVGDKAVGDLSSAQQLKADTEAFVKALANSLPATAPSAKVETFIPKDNTVKGWVEDLSKGKGVKSGYTRTDITDIINGSHDPYAKECKGFAMEYYKKGAYKVVIFLWQMNDAAGAKKMFDMNKTDGETNAGLTFSTITGVKDKAIIADDVPQWKAYAHKGPYIFKIYTTYL